MDRAIKIFLATGIWALVISVFTFSISGFAFTKSEKYEISQYVKQDIASTCLVSGEVKKPALRGFELVDGTIYCF